MKEAEYYIQSKTAELDKLIDDAFTELGTQSNRISGLTKENSELKQEIKRLESRINKTNNFIEFMLMTYLFLAIAKFIVALINR
jgi:peptidoglycan hydrolase CwlO-like protein